jgi:hypothetical protein
MSPRDVTGNGEVKNCGEPNKDWKYITKGSDKYLHKSKQQPSPQHPGIRTD